MTAGYITVNPILGLGIPIASPPNVGLGAPLPMQVGVPSAVVGPNVGLGIPLPIQIGAVSTIEPAEVGTGFPFFLRAGAVQSSLGGGRQFPEKRTVLSAWTQQYKKKHLLLVKEDNEIVDIIHTILGSGILDGFIS